MKQKIIIMGAGIGGLSTAHELSKYDSEYSKYEIIIIERNNHIGGQAAEIIGADKKHKALCWHAVSSGYKHFLDIMDGIIDDKGIKVISHLKPLNKFIYANEHINFIEYENSFITRGYETFHDSFVKAFVKLYNKKPPSNEMRKLYWIYTYANMICEKRLEKYDSIKWADYIKKFSPEFKRWLLDSTSIYLGMDYSNLSTHFMFDLFRKMELNTKLDKKHCFYSFDGSMANVVFKPWKKMLESKGVKFLLNHEICNINYADDFTTISSIVVRNKNDKTTQEPFVLFADIFVNSMDTANLAKLYPPCNNATLLMEFKVLHEKSKQIQTQVMYYIPYRIQSINTDPTILILHDSPWFLMVRIEGDLWGLQNSDILSCGIGIWNVIGMNGKKAINCTREEIAGECWRQIMACCHNLKLTDSIPKWDIWGSFKFDNINGELTTFEPKFSNNVDTLKLRPYIFDKYFTNLYHATAYCRNYTNIYNMESAAESAVKVAKLIYNKSKIISVMKPLETPINISSENMADDIPEPILSSTLKTRCSKKIKKELIDDHDICQISSFEIDESIEVASIFEDIVSIKNSLTPESVKQNTKWYFKLSRKIDSILYGA